VVLLRQSLQLGRVGQLDRVPRPLRRGQVGQSDRGNQSGRGGQSDRGTGWPRWPGGPIKLSVLPVPSWPLASMKTGLPLLIFTPFMPAIKVAV
jgi:hypothetical protein